MEKTIKKPVEEKPTVGKADRRINVILSVVLGVLCVAWIYPIVMIFFLRSSNNVLVSFKRILIASNTPCFVQF